MKRRGHVGGEVERRRSGDQDDAGASGGRGSESGGDPGPKAKLQRRTSVAEVRRGFGTTVARGGAGALLRAEQLGGGGWGLGYAAGWMGGAQG